MRYPGGKGGAGVYQTIINNIPPHDTYIETHLGGGNILERKRPAARSIGIDIDREVIQAWQQLDVDGLWSCIAVMRWPGSKATPSPAASSSMSIRPT
nr:Upf31.0 major outer membrane lipoprotein [uncultured bacterium]